MRDLRVFQSTCNIFRPLQTQCPFLRVSRCLGDFDMSLVLPLSRWKNHDIVEGECFSSHDESDLEEESIDDLPIVIPTRKASKKTKPKPKIIILKKHVSVKSAAVKRAAPEIPGPPSGPPPKRIRFCHSKASGIPSRSQLYNSWALNKPLILFTCKYVTTTRKNKYHVFLFTVLQIFQELNQNFTFCAEILQEVSKRRRRLLSIPNKQTVGGEITV